MLPRMIVVAGPPGSGKSSAFPVSAFGVAAELNGGSYHGISSKIRQAVNREFETFNSDADRAPGEGGWLCD